MSSNGQGIKKQNGLVTKVREIICSLSNVVSADMGRHVRRYRGEAKVRIPDRWHRGRSNATLSITVCDVDNGEREIAVVTSKPGAIARIVGTKLREQGIRVC